MKACLLCLGFAWFLVGSLSAQTTSPYIVIDQFGYLPESGKVAVIRDPRTGFDSDESFTPGATYALVSADTKEEVYSEDVTLWNGGVTDPSSGDKVWWFDFSSVTAEGDYYVLDVDNNVKSFTFKISSSVYNEVLKQAVRTFFYQRAGYAKEFPYAEEAWADGASHIGPSQDIEARKYNAKSNSSLERNLSGGWYDAGDYNKYTNWTANYVVDFMHAYLGNPEVWGDDYNLPESGNGTPDLLDEAKWGIDHLIRMQEDDGGVLSIVALDHASPPSTAKGQSLYGGVSTSATLNTAAAFALSAKVFRQIGQTGYADQLVEHAEEAWSWADANPDVLFYNNDASHGTSGIGAGQQEVDDYGRLMAKLEAAVYLFEVTEDTKYRDFFNANYEKAHLIQWNYAYPFEGTNQETLLYYTSLPGATEAVKSKIISTYNAAMESSDNFGAYETNRDPYRAFLKDYTWGSNSVKCLQGSMFTNVVRYNLAPGQADAALDAAEQYIHYIHGVNPLNMVYLSNMYKHGGDNCVNEFYHTWFSNGSAKWDRVGASTYGPAPGFLVGGPNPSYDWDGCCPDNCGNGNNEICNSESLIPPKDQPAQKSYKDFNTSWPLNSWSVTENSDGYQLNYIRLLSYFVDGSYDCSGVKDGGASIDACGNCAGGNTGVEPVTDVSKCKKKPLGLINKEIFKIFPNPTADQLEINTLAFQQYTLSIIDVTGRLKLTKEISGNAMIDLKGLAAGTYTVMIRQDSGIIYKRIMKVN